MSVSMSTLDSMVVAADLDGALRLDGDGGHVRQPHRHLDRHGTEAHEDRRKHLHKYSMIFG